MNRKSVLLAASMALVAAAGVARLYAAPPADGPATARWAQLRDDLNVTAEQKQQLRAIVVAHRQEIAAALRPIVEDRRAIKDAALSDPVDEAAVRAAADKLGKDLGEVALLAGKLRKDVSAVLTPAQMTTLGDFGEGVADRMDAFVDRLETGGKR